MSFILEGAISSFERDMKEKKSLVRGNFNWTSIVIVDNNHDLAFILKVIINLSRWASPEIFVPVT